MDGPSSSEQRNSDDEMWETESSDNGSSEDCDFGIPLDTETDSEWENDTDSESEKPTNQSSALQWSNTLKPSRAIPFTGSPGLKITPSGKDPIDYFNLIATDEFYQLVVTETNAYAGRMMNSSEQEKIELHGWKDLTVGNFKIWLAILFNMGMRQMFDLLTDFWNDNRMSMMKPKLSKHMSRQYFSLILKVLHFNSDENVQNWSLAKVKPLVEFFNTRMSTIYESKKELGMNELKNWNNCDKKLFLLGESNTVILKLFVCDDTENNELRNKDQIVYKLLEGRTEMGHSLYLRENYTNVPLVETLLTKNTYVTGPLKMKRKHNPNEVVNKNLSKGEMISRYTETGICVTKWKDRNETLTISSEFDGELTEVPTRRKGTVTKPKLYVMNNKYTMSEKYCEQLADYYPGILTDLRWYKKLAVNLFQFMVLNAYYLYISDGGKKMPLMEFTFEVLDKLAGPAPPSMQHFPSYNPKDKYGKRKQERCKYCWDQNKKRKESLYCCSDCPDKPGLCVDPCFKLFHEEK